MRLSSKRALQNAKSLTFEAGPMENSKSLLEGVSKRQLAGRPSVKFAFIFTFLAASVQDCHAFCPSSCTPGCLEMWLASFANTYVLAHNKIRKHPHSKSQFKSPRIANKSLSKFNLEARCHNPCRDPVLKRLIFQCQLELSRQIPEAWSHGRHQFGPPSFLCPL